MSLREFCGSRSCFVVLWGRFATDIPRARLTKNQYLQSPNFSFCRAVSYELGGREFESLRAHHISGTYKLAVFTAVAFSGICAIQMRMENVLASHVSKTGKEILQLLNVGEEEPAARGSKTRASRNATRR
jgi:hypothetical protein